MRRVAPVLLALAMAGCGLRGPRLALPPGATVESLLAGLEARRAAVRSMRARVQIRAGLAQVWAREAVVVERPRAVRVDVLSPLGLALALGTDGDRLWVFPPQEGLRYEGPATPENLARFFGTAVTSEDLVDVMLGLPPRRVPAATPRSERLRGGMLRVVVPFADGEQLLDFGGPPAHVRRAEELRRGSLVMRIDFDDYRDGFPWRVDLHGADGVAASVRYIQVERNVALDPAVFQPPPAPRVLPLEAIEVRR
ncbi:MAG TPA: hypothetical protein VNO26_10980 [Candidatus Limnocylindria bacterium]|nr:hypothetical protein [Candidatus Limnocylindria bacterium]